ncbi:MAG: chemotaxis protein CheW [bacterium]
MNEQSRKQGDDAQMVTFRLGEEMYGIDIFKIREVIHLQKISSIPNAPKFVQGVIKVRDQVIPVVNLKKRLSIKGNEGDKERIVILDLEDHLLGVIVDDISKVLKLESENYETLPDTVVREGEKACITRLAKTDDGLIIIISPDHILNRRERKALKDFEDAREEDLMNA